MAAKRRLIPITPVLAWLLGTTIVALILLGWARNFI
jgi:hypothetical protein